MFPKLVKGDEDRLQGSALIYSTCERRGFPMGTFVQYLTVNLGDYMMKTGACQEDMEGFLERWKRRSAEIERSFGKGIFLPVYTAKMEGLSELDVLASEEDVVFAGTYDTPLCCAQTINAALPFYILPFTDQAKRNNSAHSPDLEGKVAAWDPLHLDSADVDFLPYITLTYVMPMIAAQILGDTQRLNAVAADFRGYCRQFNLAKDAESLSSLIPGITQSTQITLVQKHLQKMRAIVGQNYEEAAALRDEIGHLAGLTQSG